MKSCLLILLCALAFHARAGEDSVRITALGTQLQVQKIFTGAQATQILKGFKALPWNQTPGKKCHNPIYKIEQLSKGAVTLEATVCFGCENVRFIKPEGKGLQGFDADADNVKKFHATLDAAMAAQ